MTALRSRELRQGTALRQLADDVEAQIRDLQQRLFPWDSQKGNYGSSGRPVRCVETGTVFGNADNAAQLLGCEAWEISQAIVYGRTAAGLRWEYAK